MTDPITARLSTHLNELDIVGLAVNAASEPDAEYFVKLWANRDARRVLRKIPDDNDLWADVVYRAGLDSGSQTAPGDPSSEQLKESVSDLLGSKYVTVLFRMGYRTPPPPPVSELLKMTRAAVQYVPPNPADRVRQVEVARTGLQYFVYQVASHIPNSEDRFLRRMLRHVRVVLPAVGLVAQVTQAVLTGTYDVASIIDNTQKLIGQPADAPLPPTLQFEPDANGSLGLTASALHLQEAAQSAASDLERPELWFA